MAAGGLTSRLACVDSAFPRLSHKVALAVIADLGVRAVDVCVWRGAHTAPDAVRANAAAVAAEVRGRLDELGLAVSDAFLILADASLEDHALNHPDDQVRAESFAYFERTVEFASRLGAPGITLLPGMPFDDPHASLLRAAHELRRRVDVAGSVGLVLSIEPCYESLVDTPARALQLLEQVPDLRVTLDHSHFAYQGIAQSEGDVLLSRARHVHLRQAGRGAMQLPAREGTIDFPLLVKRLDAAAYAGFLSLEYQWDDWLECKRVDCVSETAELREIVLGCA
jgi:sugar phosphate isomerase/epimerase